MKRAPRGIGMIHADLVIGGKRFPVVVDVEEDFMEVHRNGRVERILGNAQLTSIQGNVPHDVFEDLWRQIEERSGGKS